jgi:hypothetical protein
VTRSRSGVRWREDGFFLCSLTGYGLTANSGGPIDDETIAAKASAVIGAISFVWTIIAIISGGMDADEGVVVLAGTALGTIVPAAGLYAASFRASLVAARLERALDGP